MPGLYADEALAADAVFPGSPGGAFHSMEIGGWTIPLMLMPYVGALKGWVWSPVAAVFGASAASWRLPALALGALTIVLTHRFLSREAGRGTAAVCAWLIATDPTFLWTTRHDWGPLVLQRLLCVAAVAAAYAWLRGGGRRWLLLSGLAAGLGVFDKLSFHWLIVAGVLAAASDTKRWRERATPRAALLWAAGFLAGVSPFLTYAASAPRTSIATQIETEPHRYLEKWWMLRATLEGRVASGFAFRQESERPPAALQNARSLLPEALLLSLCLLPWTLRSRSRPVILFALILTLAAWAQMIPLRDTGSIHHLALVYPWPLVFVGASIAAAASRFEGSARTVWVFAVAGAVAASGLAGTAKQFGDGLRHGTAPAWSEAIYGVAEEIERRRPSDVILLEWNATHSLRFLLTNEPPVWNMAFATDWVPDNPAAPHLLDRAGRNAPLFVAFADPTERPFPDAFRSCERLLGDAGLELKEQVRIRDSRGREVYALFQAKAVDQDRSTTP